MAKNVCDKCGYIYDSEIGDPEAGIEAGTPFESLWACPCCGIEREISKNKVSSKDISTPYTIEHDVRRKISGSKSNNFEPMSRKNPKFPVLSTLSQLLIVFGWIAFAIGLLCFIEGVFSFFQSGQIDRIENIFALVGGVLL
ncbi:rubredoxin [bacterium]|nr:rubredoxin [bacterium]